MFNKEKNEERGHKAQEAFLLKTADIQMQAIVNDSEMTTQVMNYNVSNVIQQMVDRFGLKPVSNIDFCRAIGFTEAELEYVKMYWEPAFNKSMLYLSDELILGKLTDNYNNNGVAIFYTRKLLSGKYEKGVDYVEVTKEDEAVKTYYKNRPTKAGPNRRYFKVTGECFKRLLLESKRSDKYRRYFIKVEEAAILMHQYIAAVNKTHADACCESIMAFIRELTRDEHVHDPAIDGYMYVASNDAYMKRDIYKIGSTRDPAARLSSLNTSHDASDSMGILKAYYVPYYQRVEKIVHTLLSQYRNSHKREFFTISYIKLLEILDDLFGDSNLVDQ